MNVYLVVRAGTVIQGGNFNLVKKAIMFCSNWSNNLDKSVLMIQKVTKVVWNFLCQNCILLKLFNSNKLFWWYYFSTRSNEQYYYLLFIHLLFLLTGKCLKKKSTKNNSFSLISWLLRVYHLFNRKWLCKENTLQRKGYCKSLLFDWHFLGSKLQAFYVCFDKWVVEYLCLVWEPDFFIII